MAETREISVTAAWTTTFYQRRWSGHSSHAPGIIERLYQLRNDRPTAIDSGIARGAKRDLYESDFDLFQDPHPGLQQLAGFIRESVQATVSHVNGGKVKPESLVATLHESWCHITNDGGFHDAHTHAGCSWCGIYYLQLGESAPAGCQAAPNGGSRFYCPLPLGGRHQDYGNAYLNVNSLDPPLHDGVLILFPSYLLHWLCPTAASRTASSSPSTRQPILNSTKCLW